MLLQPLNSLSFKRKVHQKKGKETKRLQLAKVPATLDYLAQFMDGLLSNIINHRNHLRHYRNVIGSFVVLHEGVYLDVDFSENLSVPVKYEPQSLHWGHDQISVHSGLLKINGEKYYHPYLSDDRKHDQVFVRKVLNEMITYDKILDDIAKFETIVIESDNCKGQYKSSQHFYDLQDLSNSLKKRF